MDIKGCTTIFIQLIPEVKQEQMVRELGGSWGSLLAWRIRKGLIKAITFDGLALQSGVNKELGILGVSYAYGQGVGVGIIFESSFWMWEGSAFLNKSQF